ncbi:oxygenase MpaB family protein [Microbacterium caowuchunii]|uniref:DUF2236 domain-containing protein n=1 Tax=Microbacterium caowuchunii TaxID=2614638 RepID=A0A5N0TIU8_9MICO|nr:oxygenase MpaB family protein [Microbacterium caowuchunii]KAA9134932.1 DUF2236 domain-containing protein [Microbacterium caowuchunii]
MTEGNRSPAYTPTGRPSVVERGAHTTDDGLFGPASLTWRLHAQRAMMLVGSGAATTQMLNPRVMRMIDQASHFRQNPEARAKGTFQYIITITYGDTATAKRAGEKLRRMHQAVLATDPNTGESYNAEVAELLLWVHNTLTLTAVRAFQRYGPGLTDAEADAYVREQIVAAELVGIDPMLAPETVSELEEYMVQVRSSLAMIPEGLWFRDMMTAHGKGVAGLAEKFVKDAAIGLMLPEHRALFGLQFSRRRDRIAERATKALFALMDSKAPVERVIPDLRHQVDVAAFGARRQPPA